MCASICAFECICTYMYCILYLSNSLHTFDLEEKFCAQERHWLWQRTDWQEWRSLKFPQHFQDYGHKILKKMACYKIDWAMVLLSLCLTDDSSFILKRQSKSFNKNLQRSFHQYKPNSKVMLNLYSLQHTALQLGQMIALQSMYAADVSREWLLWMAFLFVPRKLSSREDHRPFPCKEWKIFI